MILSNHHQKHVHKRYTPPHYNKKQYYTNSGTFTEDRIQQRNRCSHFIIYISSAASCSKITKAWKLLLYYLGWTYREEADCEIKLIGLNAGLGTYWQQFALLLRNPVTRLEKSQMATERDCPDPPAKGIKLDNLF